MWDSFKYLKMDVFIVNVSLCKQITFKCLFKLLKKIVHAEVLENSFYQKFYYDSKIKNY